MTSTAPGRADAPIKIRGLSKTFKTVRAVSDLSFDVRAGAVTGFLGPAGAGKSTSLRMLLGLVSPTEGSATINGLPISKLPSPAKTIGAVLDTHSLHPARTPRAHLDIYATAIGMPITRVAQVLSTVGLGAVADHKAGSFPAGMRTRLVIATALLGDPEILVLDEPSRGLDPQGVAWLHLFLRAFAESGRTVLLTSDALRPVESVVDDVVVVSGGSLVYEGSIDDLRASSRSRLLVASSHPALLATALAARGITDVRITTDGYLTVGGTNSEALVPVATASGVTIFDVMTDHGDLEQLFQSMTAPRHAVAPSAHGPQSGYYSPPTGYYGPAGYGPSGGHR